MNVSSLPPERLAQYAESLAALRRGLSRAHRFAVFLALCNAKNTIDQAVQALSGSLNTLSFATVQVSAADVDLLERIKLSTSDKVVGATMLLGLDELLQDPVHARAVLAKLNQRRSEWPEVLTAPVVFWVSHQSAHLLLNGAPDFFDWRSDTLEFPELTQVENKVFAAREWEWGTDPAMTLLQRHARIAELRQRISMADSVGAKLTKAGWLDELAEHLELMGEWEESLLLRQKELLPIFEQAEANREIAITKSHIADILLARGDLEGALRSRREEELPVFEKLGDVRSVAITKGKIADILQTRGDLEAALRIRREDQLPVFEKLGAVLEVAITKGKIADILLARGDLEGALRSRREEELPIFEKLGDVRSVAITKGRIADILQARGDLDGALRIRRDEALPVFEKLGAAREVSVTKAKIALILQARGNLDGALVLQRERLQIAQQMQDLEGKAHAQYKIAQILKARPKPPLGDLDEVNDCLASAFSINVELGHLDGIAIVGKVFAEHLAAQNQANQAQQVRAQSDAAYAELRRQGMKI